MKVCSVASEEEAFRARLRVVRHAVGDQSVGGCNVVARRSLSLEVELGLVGILGHEGDEIAVCHVLLESEAVGA